MSDIDWKARCEKAEDDLATALRKDSIKTKEINILVRENREQKAELERVNKAYGERVEEINELLLQRDTLKAELGIARDDLRDEQSAARTDRNLRQRAEAELERVQKLLGETMDHIPSELRSRIVSAVADAQAKGPL